MAVLLGLAMLPAGAIAMQVGLKGIATSEAAYEQRLSRQTLEAVDTERDAINELREMVRVLSTSPGLQRGVGDCRAWLTDVLNEYPNVASLSVTDQSGVIRCSMPIAPAGMRATQSDLRDRAEKRDEFTLGYVSYGRLTRQPVLGALQPIRDANQRRVGFIGASISVSQLTQLLNADIADGASRAAIVDYDGRVLAEATPSAQHLPLPSAEALRANLGPQPAVLDVAGGKAVIVPLQEPDLYAVMTWAPEESPLMHGLGILLSVSAPLLIWLVAVAAGWVAIEFYVARPLSTLEAAARSMARGEEVQDTPTLDAAPAEIRSLRRTLAAMAKTLRGREQRLVEALGEERALLREIHHRVKNNLQMVASLLNIQARSAKDDSEAWGLARAHDRVQLLALVHQRIYASGEVRELRLDELVADIARQLLQGRGAIAKDVRLDPHLGKSVTNADRAVPLAFLVSESISLTLDALGDRGPSELKLSLAQDEDSALRFVIDAGLDSGEPPAAVTETRLIDAFARQLGALVGRKEEDGRLVLWVSVPPQPTYD